MWPVKYSTCQAEPPKSAVMQSLHQGNLACIQAMAFKTLTRGTQAVVQDYGAELNHRFRIVPEEPVLAKCPCNHFDRGSRKLPAELREPAAILLFPQSLVLGASFLQKRSASARLYLSRRVVNPFDLLPAFMHQACSRSVPLEATVRQRFHCGWVPRSPWNYFAASAYRRSTRPNQLRTMVGEAASDDFPPTGLSMAKCFPSGAAS